MLTSPGDAEIGSPGIASSTYVGGLRRRSWAEDGAGRSGRPRSGRYAQLAEDGGHVVADRTFRQGEPGGDLGIGETLDEVAEDVELARGETCARCSGPRLVDRAVRATRAWAGRAVRPGRWPVPPGAAGSRPPRRPPPGCRSRERGRTRTAVRSPSRRRWPPATRPSRISANGSGRSNGTSSSPRRARATRPARRPSRAQNSRTPPRPRR